MRSRTDAATPPTRRRARAAFAAFGPAFIASVAYIDPGNFATNVTAGAKYGTLLIWVVVLASLLSMVVQYRRPSSASPPVPASLSCVGNGSARVPASGCGCRPSWW